MQRDNKQGICQRNCDGAIDYEPCGTPGVICKVGEGELEEGISEKYELLESSLSTIQPPPTETSSEIQDADAAFEAFGPVPYTFRVPAPNLHASRRGGSPQSATAPPFCLQLDHTIAVLWCLFRKKTNKYYGWESELGVGQLQWARYFLTAVKSPNGGDRAEDVSIAIAVVEEALLELYANMSDVVMQPPQPSAPFSGESTFDSRFRGPGWFNELPCAVCHPKPVLIPWIPTQVPKSPCNICSSVSLGVHQGQGRPRKSIKKEPSKIPISRSPSRGLWPCTESGTDTKHDPELILEIRDLRKAAFQLSKLYSQLEDSDTRRRSLSTLQDMRKDQVSRVKDEMQRLRSFDNALGNDDDVTDVTLMDSSSKFSPDFSSTRRPYSH